MRVIFIPNTELICVVDCLSASMDVRVIDVINRAINITTKTIRAQNGICIPLSS